MLQKKLCCEMRTVTKSNPERDFFSFMSKRRNRSYICSASAQKAELKVVGVLEVMTWGGAGVSVLVCTREQSLR